jgi:hypothetical protein
MLSLDDYEDYVAECLRWASNAANESERQLYLAMAEAAKNAALARRDVISDPDARHYKPRYLH